MPRPTRRTTPPGGTPSRRSRVGRVLAALLVTVGLGVALPAAPASAHAELVSTVPAAGSVLATAPGTAELTFDEPVSLVPDGFQLYDGSGAHHTLPVVMVGATARATLPPHLAAGSYVLGWRVVSDDSHPESGVLPFAVGRADATALTVTSADTRPVDVLYGVLTGLGYVGLFLLVGLTVFDLVVTRTTTAGRRLPRTAAGVAVVAYLLLVPLTVVRERGSGLGALPSTVASGDGWGGAAAATLALAGTGVALMLLRSRLPGLPARAGSVAGAVGAVLALTSVLPVGHTRTFGPTWLVMTTDLVHAAGAAVWGGGLVALVLHLVRARRKQDDPGASAVVVGRFSTLAGGLLVMVGATGTALGLVIVGSLPALVEGVYGRLLLVKLGLVALVVVAAGWNRWRLVPRLARERVASRAWGRLATALRLEVVGLVLVLGLTSALTQSSPKAEATAAPSAAPSAVATPVSAVLGTGHLTGRFTPGRVGENELTFDVTDAGGRPVVPLGTPVVSAAEPNLGLGPVTGSVRPGATPGSYRATVVVPAAGQWQLTVAVRVSELQQPAAVADVVVVAG